MQPRFEFATSKVAYEYCLLILDVLQTDIGLSPDEALGRMNRHWRGLRFVTQEETDGLTHDLPERLAGNIAYEGIWWVQPKEARRLRPFP